jgi:hypothetical protein
MDNAAVKGKNIFLEPIKNLAADYSLSVSLCDDTLVSNCATPEEIYETILQPSNNF